MREQRRVKWHLNLRRHPSKQHGPGGAGRTKKIVHFSQKAFAQSLEEKQLPYPGILSQHPVPKILKCVTNPFGN